MPVFRPLLSSTLAVLMATTVALPSAAQTAGNASVVVASVENGEIMGANSIDDMVAVNLAGRLGLAILAQEWLSQPHTPDRDTLLEGGDPDLTIGLAMDRLLEDGRNGEMARALMAARIGYTPLLLDSAIESIFEEVGVTAQGLDVQRGRWGGPEWTGAISARDTARLAVALARSEGLGDGPMLAGSGLQCVAIQTGPKTGQRWVGIVNGAVSPEGCLAAAQSSVGLTDDRVAQAERVDPRQTLAEQAAAEVATDALGLPESN